MRLFMGYVVDIKKPVNEYDLSPLENLIVSIRFRWSQTDFVKREEMKKEERLYKARVESEEALKLAIFRCVDEEIVNNKEMGKRGWEAHTVVVSIDRSQKKLLANVLLHKEFLIYHKEIIDCDPDLVLCYGNSIPILLKLTKKVLGETYNEKSSDGSPERSVIA